jgi:hypothetical protein
MPGLGGVVEHRLDALAGAADVPGVGKIAEPLLDAERRQRGGGAALRAHHLMAFGQQGAAQGLPEEAATAGDQNLHPGPSFRPGRAAGWRPRQ